jgi:hypothetical protein
MVFKAVTLSTMHEYAMWAKTSSPSKYEAVKY